MTSTNDRSRLRALAAEYAEVTNSEKMDSRREVWRRSNRLIERTVPFQIEDNGTFFTDLVPALQCDGEAERGFEHEMLVAITNHRLIDDDRVFPPYFGVPWHVSRPSMCDVQIKHGTDRTGRQLGYETSEPLADLGNSLHKLRRGEFRVDRGATHRRAELAEGLFGDLLPVKVTCPHTLAVGTSLAYKAVIWMGMDNFYVAMIEQPENVHRFFDFIATEGVEFLDWLEAEDLKTPNSGEYCVGSGSCGYTDELPKSSGRLTAADCWAFHEAQESIGLSPAMYAEFIHPYQRRTADRFGLVYYGCCEPVHHLWPVLKGFENLRKVTVSPWCDQASIAASVGKDVVLSRKPHPMQLCGETFDPLAFEAHIRETLDMAADNFVELIFRDTCTLSGAMKDRVAEACTIVRRLIGREI